MGGKDTCSDFKKHIHCIIEKCPPRKSVEIYGINLPTAFNWQHKILDALDDVRLDGAVETDEVFMPLSFKGNHKNFKLQRLHKKRGNSAIRRGLS